MRIEKFPSAQPIEQDSTADSVVEAEKDGTSQLDFSDLLGNGFDNEFFADKMEVFPHDKIFDGWNDFLLLEDDETLQELRMEKGMLDTLFNKVTGLSSAPVMFPVFVQGLQSFYTKEHGTHQHITPDRMQRFYNYILATEGGKEE